MQRPQPTQVSSSMTGRPRTSWRDSASGGHSDHRPRSLGPRTRGSVPAPDEPHRGARSPPLEKPALLPRRQPHTETPRTCDTRAGPAATQVCRPGRQHPRDTCEWPRADRPRLTSGTLTNRLDRNLGLDRAFFFLLPLPSPWRAFSGELSWPSLRRDREAKSA